MIKIWNVKICDDDFKEILEGDRLFVIADYQQFEKGDLIHFVDMNGNEFTNVDNKFEKYKDETKNYEKGLCQITCLDDYTNQYEDILSVIGFRLVRTYF